MLCFIRPKINEVLILFLFVADGLIKKLEELEQNSTLYKGIALKWTGSLSCIHMQYIKTPLAKSRENNKTKKLRINLGHPNPTPNSNPNPTLNSKWIEKTNPNPTPNTKPNPNPKPKIHDPQRWLGPLPNLVRN